ncbi:MAG: aminodeoxychorismate synthase component I [bacterium]
MGNGDVKVVIASGDEGKTGYLFQRPDAILETHIPGEVLPLLQEVNRATAAGKCAAGYLAYEAGSALDGAMQPCVGVTNGTPLAWFGIFAGAEEVHMPDCDEGAGFRTGSWQPSMSAAEHAAALHKIREYLRSGDTYQVNFTLRLRTTFEGDPWSLFCRIHCNQRARYSAFIETGKFAVCSASPELFFQLDGDALLSKPMKGTSRRGLTSADDDSLALCLRESAKERAENIMIVDMVRNDMGRIAFPGTVEASSIFDVERYPTVLQMVSTVTCRTTVDLPEIIRALFPCASVTGAPKIRTMQIINELEPDARGVYTGCAGYVMPGRHARFNVAIRTVVVDKRSGAAEYGAGGGIVWDSEAGSEYRECLVKGEVLTTSRPRCDLLETLLWESEGGYFLLEDHLTRLAGSAAYFGVRVDIQEIRKKLYEEVDGVSRAARKVRLLVSEGGRVSIESMPLETPVTGKVWLVGLSGEPVDSGSPYLYHKTTNRSVYDSARASRPGCDDVLLVNARGEVTESTIANVVVEMNGSRFTPPVSCGLLPGTFRNWLVRRGEIEERVLTPADLLASDRLFLVNSVRRWIPARLTR